MTKIKISVVVCTYNGEKYIREQLESILSQTTPIDEIILCDDGSSDNTVNIAKEIIENSNVANHIEVNANNLGVTKNFEKAIKLTHGEVIFFSDQDDIWTKDKVTEHIKIYESKSHINMVFSNSILFNEEGTKKETSYSTFGFTGKKRRVFKKNQFRALLMGWFVTGATMSVRREFVLRCLPFGEYFLHDQWLSLLAAETNSMCAINESLIQYRQHSMQVVGAKKLTIKESMHLSSHKEIAEKYRSITPVLTNPLCSKELSRYIDFLTYRHECKNKKFFSRVGACLKRCSQYMHYKSNPLLSMIKDVFVRR